MVAGKSNPEQKSAQGKTNDVAAKVAGVSHDTISRVEQIEAKATPEVRKKPDAVSAVQACAKTEACYCREGKREPCDTHRRQISGFAEFCKGCQHKKRSCQSRRGIARHDRKSRNNRS